jgi:endo-1,4-beta-D-glucanase Y
MHTSWAQGPSRIASRIASRMPSRAPFRLPFRIACAAILLVLTVCGGCKQEQWGLWQSYSARFIDVQGRVIDPSGNRTTSEGQAYAMFFALVANDRPRFSKLLEWTEYNLAQGDFEYYLPASLWGKDKNGAWKALDSNPAFDADVWLAYTLLQAGRLWKEPGYTQLGRQLMAQIATKEVVDLPGLGPMLVPGPAGFARKGAWTLNPSYLPAFVFEGLAAEDPGGPWQKIAKAVPQLIRESSRKGYAMDLVSYAPGGGFFPEASHDAAAAPPQGSYDAIRVYLWAGMMDEKDPMRTELLSALPAMSAYLADHDAPPERVSEQGIASDNPGGAGFSAAVMPYLRATPGGGKALVKQSIRLNAMKDPASGMYGKGSTHFDQNLALFATGFMDQRFRFGPHGELKVEWSHL